MSEMQISLHEMHQYNTRLTLMPFMQPLTTYKVLKFLHCAEQNIQSSRIFVRAECNRIFTLYIIFDFT
jgi:hypothetical protein